MPTSGPTPSAAHGSLPRQIGGVFSGLPGMFATRETR
jgi:hypothetical protein